MSPTLIVITAPTHGIPVSDYVLFTPCFSHPGSQDLCKPWNAQCISVYRHTHVCGLQLHALDWTARTTGAILVSRAIVVGYVHRRLSSATSMWTIWMCAKLYYHILTTFAMGWAKTAKLWHIFFEVSLEFQSSCGTGGPFKVKGSSLWVAYPSLNFGWLHCMLDHAVCQHQSPSIPQINVRTGVQIYSRNGKLTKFPRTCSLQWHCLFTCTYIHTFGEDMNMWYWQAVLWLATCTCIWS